MSADCAAAHYRFTVDLTPGPSRVLVLYQDTAYAAVMDTALAQPGIAASASARGCEARPDRL